MRINTVLVLPLPQDVGILELGGLVIGSIFSIEIECRPPRSKSLPLTFTYLPA